MEKKAAESSKCYTNDFREVVEKEKEYIRIRREKNNLDSPEISPGLKGICFSGGGIRSATFNLGIIQGLIKAGVLKNFDYLSTVSGGGYIGGCLTSLLSGDKSKISGKELGLDPENSPFVGLNQYDDYASCDDTKLSVRHQMHHLRTHGDFLISEKGLLKRSAARALGNVISGVTHHLILFLMFLFVLVAFSHLSLSVLTNNNFFEKSHHEYVVDENLTSLESVTVFFPNWFHTEIIVPFKKMIKGISEQLAVYILFSGFGVLWAGIFIWFSIRKSNNIASCNNLCPPENTKSGYNAEDFYESKFLSLYHLPLLLAPLLMLLLSYVYFSSVDEFLFMRKGTALNYFSFFLLPFSFSAGSLIFSFVAVNVVQSFLPDQNRIHRSILDALKGASIVHTLINFSVPFLILGLFSLDYLSVIIPSVFSIVISYFLFDKGKGSSEFADKLNIPAVKKFLLNVFLVLFVAFTFSFISGFVVKNIYSGGMSIILNSIIVLISAAAVFAFWGTIVNSNKVSPHYFYRDRLTETFLKTDARIKRDKNDRQGMPLKVLRNDEDLKLSDLGNNNYRGPYHLIVTALNLQGSDELNRKTMLSEHFIFSKYFTGSKITGYVDTSVYRGGNTKLARAVTISGAAVASAMGYLSFWGQNFASTLFNARLGYWMTNPWVYRNFKEGSLAKKIMTNDKIVFWPRYLLFEMMGKVDARSRLVNLSDGGHTGDNLGIIPLLRRRCRLILVCDAEADSEYTFGSFNNAVRMAFIEENIKINIDLSKLVPQKNETGELISEESIAVGNICYPSEKEGEEAPKGTLVYIKSSISKPPLEDELIPVHILNYKKKFPDFPHQSTLDQFFDDAQFEAYRALGEYITGYISTKSELKNLFV